MSTEGKMVRALRAMAWERAKGELRSMYHTFYSETEYSENWPFLETAVEDFIRHVEDHGAHE